MNVLGLISQLIIIETLRLTVINGIRANPINDIFQILISVCLLVPHWTIIGSNWALLTIARSPNCNLTSPFGV
jgi:hypothetical protein